MARSASLPERPRPKCWCSGVLDGLRAVRRNRNIHPRRCGRGCPVPLSHGTRATLKRIASRMSVPLNQALRVGAYVVKQHLLGRKRYPLVLMLEPLFRCNLACAGCGKIDYPAEILNQRLSVAECMEAVDECGAPVVVIAGGEPLLHREIEQIVRAPSRARSSSSSAPMRCCWKRRCDLFQPSKWFSWSVHLDGDARGARHLGVPGRRVRPRGGGDRRGEACRLPHHHQRHAVQYREAGAGRDVLRRRDGDGRGRDFGVARAMRTSARRTSSIS